MAKKFNIADFVGADVSNSDTPEIELLPWEKIRGNAANFYTVDDVEDLANSIAMHGLLDPIVVTKDWEHPGEYVLISGHRRHKAWGILREQDPAKYAEIPAIVREFSSPQMGELALIMANSAARTLTAPEISRQAERTEMLLYELKQQGYQFKGRMRDQVAAACKVSATKLARLKVIREKLAECWKADWESGALAENPAYALARVPAEFQEQIRAAMKKPTGEQIERIAALYNKGHHYDNPKGLKCPDGCSCRHVNAFLNHDAKNQYAWGKCYGETCCLHCNEATRDYSRCGSACATAKAAYELDKAERNAKNARAQKAEETRLKKAIMASAARLIPAFDAAGLDGKEKIFTGWPSYTVADVRAMAAGSYKNYGQFYSDPLAPNTLSAAEVRRICELTGVSADWVMGLSERMYAAEADKADGSPQFRPGSAPPEAPTLAWCAFIASGAELTSSAVWWPTLGKWCFESGAAIDAECLGWYPLPDWRGVLREVPRKEIDND